MSRTPSAVLRALLWAREATDPIAVLLTFTHADLANPIRISTDPTQRITSDPLVYGTVSNGETYFFYPVEVILPTDRDGSAPEARLEIDNVQQGIISLIRSVSTPVSVQLDIVVASAPDDLEVSFTNLRMWQAVYDAQKIDFSLAMDALFNEPYPGLRFTQGNFPSIA